MPNYMIAQLINGRTVALPAMGYFRSRVVCNRYIKEELPNHPFYKSSDHYFNIPIAENDFSRKHVNNTRGEKDGKAAKA